jgi:hypothetical protein
MTHRAITVSIVGLASALSRLVASLRPSGLAALTAPPARPGEGIYVMARETGPIDRRHLGHPFRIAAPGALFGHLTQKGRITMPEISPMPRIAVTIGRETRLYHAFVTTAPATLDGPSTMTLYGGTFADVSGLAADPISYDAARAKTPARLVLIEASERVWHRDRYRSEGHLLATADSVLVGLNTLQHWLWQRLHAPLVTDVHG